MPQVPYRAYPEQSPQGADTPFQSAAGATPEAFGSQIGAAEQNLGAAVGHFGDVMSKHAVTFADRANQSAATDLYTQASIEVGNLDAKHGELEGKARADALPDYQKGILDIQEKYRSMSDNVDVQHQFDNDFKRRAAYSIVDEAKKSAGAMKAYNNKSQAARISLAQQDAEASVSDDNRFKLAMQETESSINALARENNWGPDDAEVYRRKAIGDLYLARFKAMAISDPFRAKTLYEQDKDQVDGAHRLQIERYINEGIIKGGSRIDADKIWNGQSGVEDKVKTFEGFRPKAYQDFKQWSIGYGTKATSPNEVIDRPEAERRFSAEFGKARDSVEAFNPNLDQGTKDALTSLTYNAGPGWMQSGLGAAVKTGDLNVIRDKLLQYNQAGGAPNAALMARRQAEAAWIGKDQTVGAGTSGKLEAALNQVPAFANARFPDDPGSAAQYEDTLRSRITAQYNTDVKVQKEHRSERLNTVVSELMPHQDGSTISTIDQLSPRAQDAYFNMDPPEQRRMQKLMESNAKGIVYTTPERRNNFEKLWGLMQNPATRSQFEDSGWEAADLSTVDRQRLFQGWTKIKSGGEGPSHLSTALQTLRPMLNSSDIGPSSSDASKNDRYNQFAGALDVKIREYLDENKALPNEEQLKKIGAALLTDREGTGWFTNDKQFEVPRGFVNEANKAYRASGKGRDLTPSELFRLYRSVNANP